jgi:hypothetical protein
LSIEEAVDAGENGKAKQEPAMSGRGEGRAARRKPRSMRRLRIAARKKKLMNPSQAAVTL